LSSISIPTVNESIEQQQASQQQAEASKAEKVKLPCNQKTNHRHIFANFMQFGF